MSNDVGSPADPSPQVSVQAGQNKRHPLIRVFFSILWFLPLVLVVNMVVGGFVGGFAGSNMPAKNGHQSFSEGYADGYAVGQDASRKFFRAHGRTVYLGEVALWLYLSIAGILPGSGKFKRTRNNA